MCPYTNYLYIYKYTNQIVNSGAFEKDPNYLPAGNLLRTYQLPEYRIHMDSWRPLEQCVLFQSPKPSAGIFQQSSHNFFSQEVFLMHLNLKSFCVSSDKFTLIFLTWICVDSAFSHCLPLSTAWISELLWHREKWTPGTDGLGVGHISKDLWGFLLLQLFVLPSSVNCTASGWPGATRMKEF